MKRNKLQKITGNRWHLMIYSLYNCGMRPARIIEMLKELGYNEITRQTVYVTVKKIQKEIDLFDISPAESGKDWETFLSNRAVKCLKNAGVNSKKDLLNMEPVYIFKIRGLGKHSWGQIREFFFENGSYLPEWSSMGHCKIAVEQVNEHLSLNDLIAEKIKDELI